MNKTDMLGLTILIMCILYLVFVFLYSELEVYINRDPIDWLLGEKK